MPRDDWKRWVLDSPPRNSSSSRRSFFGISFFSHLGFSDVNDSYNSNGHVSRVARRRVDSFLRIFHRDRNCERPDQKMRGERREREKETGPGGCARGEKMRERREKGRSVGRRFHFVSLPACGGAIAAALCQSVTLSRHPFYYLAKGCPAHSTSYQPRCADPGPPFRHPLRA